MPLRSLFNPSLYSSNSISTGLLLIRAPAPTKLNVSTAVSRRKTQQAHRSTMAAPPSLWKDLVVGSSLTAPSIPVSLRETWEHLFPTQVRSPPACCPHHSPHPTSVHNHDTLYWQEHQSRIREQLVRHFHEIERLYRGNVEYVKRMSEVNPGLLQGLAFQGQKPPFMLVDCSDSRVNEQGIFDAEPGTMFTAGNIANMFDEEDPNSNAVLSYAVETLQVKHVVVLGHYGCGGVAASMAPLPEGYAERYLTARTSESDSLPADLAVQRWITPIRHIYQTSGRTEIRAHRERIARVLESGRLTREEVARRLMAQPSAVKPISPSTASGSVERQREEDNMEMEGIHLHDPAFRALVEENVKANVWRLMRSRVIKDHYKAYSASLAPSYTGPKINPIYVHGWVYDLENGVVSDLNVSTGPPGWVPPVGGVQGGFPFSLRG